MIRVPSKYQNLIVEDPIKEIYVTDDPNEHVEQSAIYDGIEFPDSLPPGPGIVLTSQCDIQKGRDDNFIKLARIVSLEIGFINWLVTEKGYTKQEALGNVKVEGKKRQRQGVIDDYASVYLRNKKFQYYFLHELPDKLPHSLICFEVTTCMTITEVEAKTKICILNSPFREAVPSHYSAYMGRIGTAEFDKTYLKKVMDDSCYILDN